MTKNEIMLIGENKVSFMLNSIEKTLQSNGYQVTNASLKVDEISKQMKETNIFLFYEGDAVDSYSEVLTYLKDICVEYERKLYIIGYKDALDEITHMIPESIINGTFLRPLNVKEMVDTLNQQVSKDQQNEQKKHILVVDDSGATLRTVKSWLSAKYKVSMANSAAMAISFLAVNKPDLILLDYEMPICSGPQVMEMIHAEYSTEHIPIMFLTGKSDKESVKKVLSLHPVGYLLKTMPAEEIIKSIDEFFEKQKMKSVTE